MAENNADAELEKLKKASAELDLALSDNGKTKATKTGRFLWIFLKVSVALFIILLALPPFYRPVDGVRSSGYLFRMRPETNLVTDWEFHRGVDFAAVQGTAVHPVAAGVVESSGWSDSFGNYIIVRHLFGIRSLYAHLSMSNVDPGSLVFPGFTTIGYVGSTGRATGPHLHVEFRIGGRSLPPGLFLFFHNLRKYLVGF